MAAITNDMQAYLTGNLMAHCMMEKAKTDLPGGIGMAIKNVAPLVDEEGLYENTFIVTFASGLQMAVSVSEVTEIIEE